MLNFWLQNLWQIILMVVLLILSAFFSGSETAFFNLSHRQIQSMKNSRIPLHRVAADMLLSPKRLLTSLLFANMAVNVLYFALSSILTLNINSTFGPGPAAVCTVIIFSLLVLLGEMLPKSVAYSFSQNYSVYAAPVCLVCMKILAPLLTIFDWLIIEPGLRLFAGVTPFSKSMRDAKQGQLTGQQFKLLIEASRQQGLIGEKQNQLLAQVIELGLLKVRHVMVPRVDIPIMDIREPRESIISAIRRADLTSIAVYDRDPDKISGALSLRKLILEPNTPVEQLLEPVNFVPEQKSVESLLEFFRTKPADMAIVVNEYGGIEGMVTLESIIFEMLSPIDPSQQQDVEQIGPLEYRLTGDTPIYEWAEIFDIDLDQQKRLATLSGYVAARLGKIPKSGDKVAIKNMTLTVENVSNKRVMTLLLSLSPETSAAKKEGRT